MDSGGRSSTGGKVSIYLTNEQFKRVELFMAANGINSFSQVIQHCIESTLPTEAPKTIRVGGQTYRRRA